MFSQIFVQLNLMHLFYLCISLQWKQAMLLWIISFYPSFYSFLWKNKCRCISSNIGDRLFSFNIEVFFLFVFAYFQNKLRSYLWYCFILVEDQECVRSYIYYDFIEVFWGCDFASFGASLLFVTLVLFSLVFLLYCYTVSNILT